MNRQANQFDPTNDAALELPPSTMMPRQRLEWEVSQLADGTLAPERRAAVEAALLGDSALRADYEAHRRLDALLRDPPHMGRFDLDGLNGRIMSAVRQEQAPGERSGTAARSPLRLHAAPRAARVPTTASTNVAGALRGWWVTIAAAAAALAVGLSAGLFVNRSGDSRSVVEADPQPVAESRMQVTGPAEILRPQQDQPDGTSGAGGNDAVATMTVTGPDYHAVLDPQGSADVLLDHAAAYGGSAVLDTPSHLIVASADREP